MADIVAEVVRSIDRVNENQWNNVVSQSGMGTVFQRTGWLRAVERGLQMEPRHVVARKNGNPVAVWPNFVSPVDLPVDPPAFLDTLGFTQLSSISPGFGGPLVLADRDETLELLFETVRSVSRDVGISHRTRILDPTHVQYARAFREHGYRPSLLLCRLWLMLDDYDRIRDGMAKERRKELRDAMENDPTVREEDVDRNRAREFYREYRKTMDRVDGRQYPPAFFDALADSLGDRLEIFTAYVDGQQAGKHLYVRDDEQDSLHYFFAGVDERYFEYSSPTVLHDYAIRWGLEHDYDVLDFGESSASYADGTFSYKRKFGARPEPVYEWERGFSPLRWSAYRVARRLYLRYQDSIEG